MVAHPISASQGAGLVAETAVFLVAVFAVFYFTANTGILVPKKVKVRVTVGYLGVQPDGFV